MHRNAILGLALLFLAACHGEPDFDERYDAASQKIRDKAADIDARISGTGTPEAEVAQEDQGST
ncbi:hypothetical protein [Novosphingobium mathurense]|uniref:Lipoprotein n=1 Tax=Novosphingobium mathurense TaxID=428990 RepID=A0A1U6GWR3_9SPHN|nr:hypothetical protein [Novosphingobium mathurense]SLJ87908.1 hypothetical protein SAMN06295987_101704 [Novosphingobium mathurense]